MKIPNIALFAQVLRKHTGIAALLSSLIVAFTGFAQEKLDDRDSIRAAFQNWIRVCEAGSADDYVTYITEDAVIMAPKSSAVAGRSAILPWVKAFFARTTFAFSDWKSEEILVAGDTAIHRYTGVALLSPREGGKATREGRQYIDVLRRGTDGRWRVSHHIYNVVSSGAK